MDFQLLVKRAAVALVLLLALSSSTQGAYARDVVATASVGTLVTHEERSGTAGGGFAQMEVFLRAGRTTRSMYLEDVPNLELSVWPIFGVEFGVRADGNARLFQTWGPEDATPAEGQADSDVLVQLGVLDLSLGLGWQRTTSMDRLFWRSNLGQLSLRFGLGFPRLFGVQGGRSLVELLTWSFYLEERYALQSIQSAYSGRDAFLEAALLRWSRVRKYEPLVLAVMDVDLEIYTMPPSTTMAVEDSSTMVRLRMLSIEGISGNEGRHLVDIALGLTQLMPLASAVADEARPTSVAPYATLGFRAHGRSASGQVSAGTFHRVDPTGLGVDFGGQLRLSTSYRKGRMSVGLVSTQAIAQRVLTSVLAPERAQEGEFLLLRGDAYASFLLRNDLSIDGHIWGEKSDRFDALRPTDIRGVEDRHSGVQLSLRYHWH